MFSRLLDTDFIRQVGACRWLARTAWRQFAKRVLRADNRIALPNGRRMFLPRDNAFASEVFVTGCDVDWGAEDLLEAEMSEGGVFLDVGAHIGYYALRLCHRAGRVFAFEPDPRNLGALGRNAGAGANIEIVPMAVGASPGRARFHVASSSQLSSLSPVDGAGTIEVDVTTIDAFRAARGLKIDAIKTDIQGADLDALRGARDTLREDRPSVVSEVKNCEEVHRIAGDADYVVFAHVRQLGARRPVLTRLERPGAERVKMVFLVPAERGDAFLNRGSCG